jgi:hypothetical protein
MGSIRFCVVANRGRAFFGVCDFGCTHFLFFGGNIMFENVGQKIKNYAKALFVGQLILYIVGGIILIAVGVDGEEAWIFVGIALLALGWVIAWLNSVFIYGFGELIVKTTEVERNTRGGEKKSEVQAKVDDERLKNNYLIVKSRVDNL